MSDCAFSRSYKPALLVASMLLFALLAACSGPNVTQPGSSPSTVEIHAVDLKFQPNALDVAQSGRYTIKLVNNGSVAHNLTFSNGATLAANAGETKTVDVDIPAGGLSFLCSLPGHAEAGMKGTIAINGTTMAGMHDDHAALSADVQADPSAPPPLPYDATAPALLSGTEHKLDIAIQERNMTVAPGFVQHVWTFNGSVPAPTIRVRVGDIIHVHFSNPASSSMPHSLDFHASQGPWNGDMVTLSPGQSKDFTWTADYAGVWMYHCITEPAVQHVANGMYGMVIVEPKAGLPKVDKEFVVVQSEWYYGPQGQPASYTKAAAGAPSPDTVVFNGVADQYDQQHALKVGVGEKVRMFVLNVGPNIESSFHVVGGIFYTVIKEGVALTADNPGHYGSQAVDLAPAQGAIVEFTLSKPGFYPFVTHTFNFHGRGAMGLLQAGDGVPPSN